MRHYFLIPVILLISFSSYSQDTTRVVVDLNQISNEVVSVKVFPPVDGNSWEYVIPEIIPGTYVKVNYVRFYDQVTAYDNQGRKVKVKKSKNVLQLAGEQSIAYLEYSVSPSIGARKIWDNVFGCGGSAYNSESALINFQLVNGYFEGYKNQPFKIEVKKPAELYGASSIHKITKDPSRDILIANGYDQLIDQPILYAKADTSSFTIGGNKFNIAVYAGAGKMNAEIIKPRFEAIMNEIHTFSGFTSKEDYTFILYCVDKDKLKGLFKEFALGSALEHKTSSVYYMNDYVGDSTFSYYNEIAAHEYYHTITPLNLHSEQIANFNFRKADMSRSVWMYEGITDYLALMLNAQSENLTNRIAPFNIASATQIALNRRQQSLTESGRNIIRKGNVVSWVNKLLDLINFYAKGQIIAMMMDMELQERTNGQRRLLDVMLEMKKDYENGYFEDTQLLSILEKYTYPGFAEQFKPFVEGTDQPPYQTYFDKIGWTFYPKKSKNYSYGSLYWSKDKKTNHYYIRQVHGENQLGLEMGDTLLSINNVPVQEFMDAEQVTYNTIRFPEADEHLTVIINRGGEIKELTGSPKLTKFKYARMKVNDDISAEQRAFRKSFFYEK